MIYLASPYSAPGNPLLEEIRFFAVLHAAWRLMKTGSVVFSPVVHGHPVSKYAMPEPQGHEFWMAQCLPMLRLAERLVVLRLQGWERSSGVRREIDEASALGIPVEYIDQ